MNGDALDVTKWIPIHPGGEQAGWVVDAGTLLNRSGHSKHDAVHEKYFVKWLACHGELVGKCRCLRTLENSTCSNLPNKLIATIDGHGILMVSNTC